MFCPNCGERNDEGGRFCTSCGTLLSGSAKRVSKGVNSKILICAIAGFLLVILLALFISLRPLTISTSLTRSKARTLILQSEQLSNVRSNAHLHKNGFQKGIEQEMWDNQMRLTLSGQTYFTKIDYGSVKLAKEVAIEVEVTGITDIPLAQGMKEAQFVWNYKELPPVVKRFVGDGGYGQGEFRRYDDGWRLETVSVVYSDEPAKQSEAEVEKEKKDMIEIAEQKRLREEKERIEQERLASILQESKRRTKILKSFLLQWEGQTSIGKKKFTAWGEISDVDLSIKIEEFNLAGSISSQSTIWFGTLANVNTGFDPASQLHMIKIEVKGRLNNMGGIQPYVWYSSNAEELKTIHRVLTQALDDWRKKHKEVVDRNLQ